MELLFLLMVGAGAFLIFKARGRWDTELMRAHVFLDALAKGEPLNEANRYAMLVMALPSTKGIRNLARLHALHDFNGKPAEMIQTAYDAGLAPALSSYEREFFSVAKRSSSSPQASAGLGTAASNKPVDSGNASAQSDNIYRFYYAAYITELRRLAGTSTSELHPVELMEDENVRMAFRDDIDPLVLAALVHNDMFAAN